MASGIIRLDEGWRLDEGHHLDQPPVAPPPYALPVRRPRNSNSKRMATADFIPNKRAERYLWWKNLKDNLATEGPKMGLTAPQITAAQAVVDDQVTKMDARDAAKGALDAAINLETLADSTNEAAIRTAIRNWKTLPGYASSGSEAVLQLKGSSGPDLDPVTYKPVLTKLTVTGGQIRIDFTKAGVDALNIYTRLRGTVGWRKLAMDSASPYYDTEPLANANQPETREYKARGVKDDVEIGQDSDVVSIVFGG